MARRPLPPGRPATPKPNIQQRPVALPTFTDGEVVHATLRVVRQQVLSDGEVILLCCFVDPQTQKDHMPGSLYHLTSGLVRKATI